MIQGIKKNVARRIQGDIPVEKRPFAAMGKSLQCNEDEVIAAIKELMEDGIVRKFGAILNHRKAGVGKNAMVVWAMPESLTQNAGRALAARKEVSHCYERSPQFMGKYNLFTMVHAKTGDIAAIVADISASIGITDYLILATEEEFKKTSMEYFLDE